MAFFKSQYGPKNDAERAEIEALPLFFRSPIDGNLKDVCNTLILTAGCDPLRDEGEAYGHQLVAAGVRVTFRRYTGVPHPFMHMLVLKKAQMYMDDMCSELTRVHVS